MNKIEANDLILTLPTSLQIIFIYTYSLLDKFRGDRGYRDGYWSLLRKLSFYFLNTLRILYIMYSLSSGSTFVGKIISNNNIN